MNNTRHTFKKDNTKIKLDFIASMFDLIDNSEESGLDKITFKNVVEYFAENTYGHSFLTIKRVLSHILTSTDIKDKDLLIEAVCSQLNSESKSSDEENHSNEYHDEQQVIRIANEFNQIRAQTDEMLGKSVKIINDVDIIKIDEEKQAQHIDNVDLVEAIDLGSEMDDDLSLKSVVDLDDDLDKFVCIFCEGSNVLIISSSEGYCKDCDKKFLIHIKY